jgi:lysozyme
MNPRVIDLSHHQTPRDLSFARASGIRAAIIKCSQGVGGADQNYPQHLWFAQNAGLLTGAYHFGTGKMAGAAQADYFYSRMMIAGGVAANLALDVEENPDGLPMSLAQVMDFMGRIKSLTFGLIRPPKIEIYGGAYLRQMGIPVDSPLLEHQLWLADYAPPPTVVKPWPTWTLWQYTDRTGAQPGPDPLDGYDLSEAIDGDATIDQLWGVA